LKNNGITTDACYPYSSIITGEENQCLDKCADGTAISETYKATYLNLTSIEQVKDYVLYEGPVITLIEGKLRIFELNHNCFFLKKKLIMIY